MPLPQIGRIIRIESPHRVCESVLSVSSAAKIVCKVTFGQAGASNCRNYICKRGCGMKLGILGAALMLGMAAMGAAADPAAPLSALAKMPVKEITVFKDGHAFVLHEGKMPTDAKGDVQM